MAIQYFLVFIGSVLGCSIALALVVKNLSQGIAVGGKKPFVYGSVSAIVTSVGAHLASYVIENPFTVFWILGSLFLLFGLIHVVFIHSRYFYAYRQNANKVLFAEILFGFSVILFSVVIFCSLQYFLKNEKNFLFYPILMSTLLFFVPLLVFHAYEAAFNIPATVFPAWEYPLYQPIDLPDDNSSDKIVVIGFEIGKKNTDSRKTYFRAKGPETMKLGDFFYHFVNEYNDRYSETTIECTNKVDEPSEWWFHRKPRWYQTHKIYNPEMSMRENGIRENTVIICERLYQFQSVAKSIQ
jgi:hypothetical protein